MAWDVCIVGGGIMGLSTAVFLKRLEPGLSVCVVEPDPTYAFASTTLAAGGARRLFSRPENIEMSNYSIDFLKRFSAEMAVDGDAPDIGWREEGYLFLVPPAAVAMLQANVRLQESLGVEVVLMDAAELKRRYPSMTVDDVGAAELSPRDGWCDPSSVLQGFRRMARALGVTFVQDRVTGLDETGGRVRRAVLEAGEPLVADRFVIAAGAWSAPVAASIGMTLPISPMRRFEHFFDTRMPIEPLPFVKDLARLAFRPEGTGYTGTVVNSDEPRGVNFDPDPTHFEAMVWPALAHRFPAFEATRCIRSWAGLYEVCELDGSPVIGNWRDRHPNVHVIAGFSGHGLMHAPAAGRGIAELIVHGEFRSIDLGRLGYDRVLRNEPYAEVGIL
ncbi:FAD-dependent oxidoreductase [Thalassobaculum sp.]|uniref:NAD(P)/FAD-dependent oxidoreductase n=1 Tax=Thalassobaculum sp. TaxID=2022740 RepID=UPI0032F04C25